MCDITTILLAVFVVFGPAWLLFRFLGQLVASRGLNKRDAAALDQIAAIAARMESRLDVVERILDADSPSWRGSNPAGRYNQQAG
jgi:phage shock protein B